MGGFVCYERALWFLFVCYFVAPAGRLEDPVLSALDSQFHVLDAGYHRDSASPWRRRRRRRQLTGTHHQATTTAAARRARRACSLRRIPIGSREEAGSHSALDMSAVAVEGLRGLFPLEVLVLGPRLELGAWSCAISVRLLIAGSWELGVPTGPLSWMAAWWHGGRGGRGGAAVALRPRPFLLRALAPSCAWALSSQQGELGRPRWGLCLDHMRRLSVDHGVAVDMWFERGAARAGWDYIA